MIRQRQLRTTLWTLRKLPAEGHHMLILPDDDVIDGSGEYYAEVLASVAEAISHGQANIARSRIAPIAGEVWRGRIPLTRSKSSREPNGAPPRKRRKLPERLKAEVFSRDGFRCTSCGGRTIPRNVLVALSDAYPDELPYNRHYTAGTMHPAYWVLAPEADHILPHSRGGQDTIENLTTMHAACNTSKSDSVPRSVPSAGLTPAHDSISWDGLIDHYRSIVALGDAQGRRHAAPGYHERWLRAFGV